MPKHCDMSDRYLIPASCGQAEYTEKKSRFIARVWPVETEEEALTHIKEMREKHWDATHNVYAYKLREGNIQRYSDDGEPQGTSGIPTLQVFIGRQIENFCCVVTRYFGGTLLGTGGLVRAYSHSAKLALEKAGIAAMGLWKTLEFSVPYARLQRVRAVCDEFEGIVENMDYGVEIAFTVLLPAEKTQAFSAALFDKTQGAVQAQITGESYRAVQIKNTENL